MNDEQTRILKSLGFDDNNILHLELGRHQTNKSGTYAAFVARGFLHVYRTIDEIVL